MNISSSDSKHPPFLSIILIVYRMREQARKTLFTLSPAYQEKVTSRDYEVVVVENASDQNLDEDEVLSFGENYKYILQENTGVSPVAAINHGVDIAKGKVVGIMVDGARMLTPGVIRYILAAYRISSKAIVAVPGYHLGSELQQDAVDKGYNESTEAALLKQINWPQNGYDLFKISCLSGSCRRGFFLPMSETNCLCIPKDIFVDIGGCDLRFDLPGGGAVNLDLYKRVCELPDMDLFILNGEGTFHQFHGGVTTGRSRIITSIIIKQNFAQYKTIRGEIYKPPTRQGIYLGALNKEVMKFLSYSFEKVLEEENNYCEKTVNIKC